MKIGIDDCFITIINFIKNFFGQHSMLFVIEFFFLNYQVDLDKKEKVVIKHVFLIFHVSKNKQSHPNIHKIFKIYS